MLWALNVLYCLVPPRHEDVQHCISGSMRPISLLHSTYMMYPVGNLTQFSRYLPGPLFLKILNTALTHLKPVLVVLTSLTWFLIFECWLFQAPLHACLFHSTSVLANAHMLPLSLARSSNHTAFNMGAFTHSCPKPQYNPTSILPLSSKLYSHLLGSLPRKPYMWVINLLCLCGLWVSTPNKIWGGKSILLLQNNLIFFSLSVHTFIIGQFLDEKNRLSAYLRSVSYLVYLKIMYLKI